ncbi:MAG: ABC transporter substrate-binding protein [Candidatus Wallbacteria bacterium]|nr:ABC transporter substrate-binding protein [Candidatus Wallbacteria bacterium]
MFRNRDGQLKPGGIVLLLILAIALLVAGSTKLREQLFPPAAQPQAISADELRKISGGGGQPPPATVSQPQPGASGVQQPLVAGAAPAAGGATTVNEYKFVGKSLIKPIGQIQSYSYKNDTVVFPINIWGGWAPIIAANNGFKANKDCVFFKEFGFQVDLKLIDDPDAARAAFASGQSHVLWGTLDMIALFAEGLAKDPRVFPKVCQQIDWSNGGDGVVVRAHVQSANDLRGKTIVLAQNSPSHYYILRVLAESGVSPSEVNFKFTDTAFGAARAFVDNSSIDACVSWSPDIYNIVDEKNGGKKGGVKGARLLTTTKDANNMIADVWAVRSDFYADHRDVVKGLVIGIFKGMDVAAKDPDKVAALMADGFGLGVEECKGMMGDAHTTNFAENLKFFTDADFAANYDRTWRAASYVYKQYGAIGAPVRPEDSKDASLLREVAPLFPGSKEAPGPAFSPAQSSKIRIEAEPILTKTVMIQF